MKISFKILAAFVLLAISTSETFAQDKKVKGNGNVITKNISTADYDYIQVVGSIEAVLEKGTEGNIAVTVDENLQQYIIVEVTGNTLKLTIENYVSLHTTKGIKIQVPFQEIKGVKLTGSGEVKSADVITASQLEIELTGSGDMQLDVNTKNLDAKLTGSGDMKISGTTEEMEIKLIGSGDFQGSSMKVESTQAYVSGSGTAKVAAQKSLKARINGSGDIKYSGSPKDSDTKVMGSGSIKAI